MGNYFCKKKTKDDYTDSFFTKTNVLLQTTDLSENQKIIFRRRYMNKLYSLRKYKHIYAVWFYLHRFLETTLGVAIPALLSIQYYYGEGSVNNPIYWSAWGLSIFSGIVTGYNNIFKVDQRYFLLRSIYQKMKNEGWIFILLCKKYDILNENKKRKHSDIFTIFMESIEEIIDNYNKNDMETVMAIDSKINEESLKNMLQSRSIEDDNQPEIKLNLPNLPDPPDLPQIVSV